MALEELNIVVEHWKCDHRCGDSHCWDLKCIPISLFIIQSLQFEACNSNLTIPNNSNYNKLPTTTAANATRRAPSVCASSSSAPHFFGGAFCCSNIALSLCCCCSRALFQRLCFSRSVFFFFFSTRKEEKRVNTSTVHRNFYCPHIVATVQKTRTDSPQKASTSFDPFPVAASAAKYPPWIWRTMKTGSSSSRRH